MACALSRSLRDTIAVAAPPTGVDARGVGAESIRSVVGVALLDLDVGGRDPELFGDDLREGGLVALALDLTPSLSIALPVGCTRSSAESNIRSPAMS